MLCDLVYRAALGVLDVGGLFGLPNLLLCLRARYLSSLFWFLSSLPLLHVRMCYLLSVANARFGHCDSVHAGADNRFSMLSDVSGLTDLTISTGVWRRLAYLVAAL